MKSSIPIQEQNILQKSQPPQITVKNTSDFFLQPMKKKIVILSQIWNKNKEKKKIKTNLHGKEEKHPFHQKMLKRERKSFREEQRECSP